MRRKLRLPLMLFLATCLSTFWVGSTRWMPLAYLGAGLGFSNEVLLPPGWMPARQMLVTHWQDGLIYMGCVLLILLTHEMGHFLATIWYKIPASYPIFLPIPINAIGTLGAVIGMDGSKADRRQIFDIGIAGPLAGLVVAIPIIWIGTARLDFDAPAYGGMIFNAPLAIQFLYDLIQPAGYTPGAQVVVSQLNPFFMAGWIGLLITGLNMLPVSQLDGGHVIHGLLGRNAKWIARGFMVFAIAYVVYAGVGTWMIMITLVLFMGSDHPPTRDDNVQLGWPRMALGIASLSIPLLCFPPNPMEFQEPSPVQPVKQVQPAAPAEVAWQASAEI
ncbi:site-2 protease family protein [Lignipirellula cremea]|uniref:Peptidase family M50 n=1 Tax=Lignipirellula cremea TaxID=2528010 RepID=A0A518DUL4_9BACT|nr:site-2 protease family protein [Lignipirellula cremea]QDU95527.1 Peptidase family M50 [Lignipirellula cremea]